MRLLLDSGALIALDRGQRAMWTRLKATHAAGQVPLTHGGVVGQVWRDGPRQARLASALAGVDVRPLDERLGRAAGTLLARARTVDVVDAALAALAEDGDGVLTSDPRDLATLLATTGRHVEIFRV